MGHSMLGPHINWKADQIPWLQKTKPRVAKVLLQNVDKEWMRKAHDASPDTFWVGRLIVYPQPLDSPVENAKHFANNLLLPAAEPFREIVDALEGYNEIAFSQLRGSTPDRSARSLGSILRAGNIATVREEMQRYAAFERERCQILAAAGWKSIVGNFSGGTPELEVWPDFYPALDAGDYLGLHEYSANTQPPFMPNLDTWLCRRYRRVYESLPDYLRLPLVITECGIDGGMLGHAQEGWKRYTDEAGYMADLAWYDSSLQEDAQRWPIVGATVYCYGHVDPHWGSFDIGGAMAERLAGHMQANPPLPWKAPDATPPDPLVEMLKDEFGDEFDDIRGKLAQTGQFDPRRLDGINFQVIHHTGDGTTPQTYSNTIATYHVENNGWPAIGYHFLIYGHKVRFVGSLETARANVWGRNAEVIGISVVGNYSSEPPSASALALCKRLCDALDRYLGRILPRVGHRDVALPGHETSCPGDAAYGPNGWLQAVQPSTEQPPENSEVQRLRARVAELEQQLQSSVQEINRLRDIIGRVREAIS